MRLLASVKDYQRAIQHGGPLAMVQAKLAVARHRFWSVVTGAEIPLNMRALGERLHLPHPNGIVIHPDVEVGADCRIFQQVTLGTGPKPGVPRVGANVHIGAGAKILGGVHIGDCAVIGANAVVVSDIPAGMTAAGVPTQLKPHARGEWDRDKRTHLDREDSTNKTLA
jgi:serine O-acetyltransferase